ncbi:MAG: DUF429 domain-containing protein [Rhodococcus sp. (in: high G+C Gram-positive bacteria)]|uniref:DUF429 domain-containing protein n=1 Tax=Rhodococcus sp. EPR-157 TaxID=1813677 RepID=UPI0009ED1753|nr:DUF429 domain-containing protein [Rhodococcus sp. EPR-157]
MSSRTENTVAGVDGAKGRWVIARFDGDRVDWTVERDAESVLAATASCTTVGVDMPLTMPTNGYRASEVEAKIFLGPARSSIFHTPVHATVEATSYADACAISRDITGKAISMQTWHLMPAIRSWQSISFDTERVVEVHPECSFRLMAPDVAFASKKSGRGAGQRMAALSRWIDPHDLADGLARLPVGPALDDALDAAAAAWSAWRFSRGDHRSFGTTDSSDRIVA